MINKKKKFILLIIFLIFSQLHALIIYRPVNNGDMNDIKCYLRILDEKDNDVTYTAARVYYAWIDQPHKYYSYKKKYYLMGGIAMHVNLKPGKYKITVYTPKDAQNGFECENKDTWESNTFYYNTENKLNVLFVSPTANDNLFYNGGWYLDYKAPKFRNYTFPHIQNSE